MSETQGDASVSSESAAPSAPEVVVPEVVAPEPVVVETQAAASPPPISASETTPVSESSQTQEVAKPASYSSIPTVPAITSYLSQALDKIQFRKRAKLEKILALVAKKKSIKNDDVQLLLRVSDSSATNYLNQLVRNSMLKRVGNAHQPTYEPL